MGRKRTPGLYKRGSVWHIDKYICGQRLRESCQTDHLEEAEKYLARKSELIRQAIVYGVRPKRMFREAATRYLLEGQYKARIRDEAWALKEIDKYVGQLTLEAVHMGSLQSFIEARRREGVKNRTINYSLQVIRHILNLAASEWLDERGMTWLASPPKIKLIPETDRRKPYPLTWEEQQRLFSILPFHIQQMALFAVNSGCRDREICELRWEWEVNTPEGSVFIIPGVKVKNREDRLVVLNDIAREVVEKMRGIHSEYVFTYKCKPFYRMMTTAWKKARKKVGLLDIRIHDLKHTYGRRLRSAGVSFEDRQDLLGHKSGRITTHYSAAELTNLIRASNKACVGESSPILTILRTPNWSPHKDCFGKVGKYRKPLISLVPTPEVESGTY